MLSCASFWFEDRIGLHPPAWNLLAFGRYPLTIYSGGIQFFLSWIVPFGFATFYPERAVAASPRISPVRGASAFRGRRLLRAGRSVMESGSAPLLVNRLVTLGGRRYRHGYRHGRRSHGSALVVAFCSARGHGPCHR